LSREVLFSHIKKILWRTFELILFKQLKLSKDNLRSVKPTSLRNIPEEMIKFVGQKGLKRKIRSSMYCFRFLTDKLVDLNTGRFKIGEKSKIKIFTPLFFLKNRLYFNSFSGEIFETTQIIEIKTFQKINFVK